MIFFMKYLSSSFSLGLALLLLSASALPAQAELVWGGVAELGFLRGPTYPADPKDSKTSLLAGLFVSTSGIEARPQVLISEGQYKGLLLDADLRITPKWFGQQEYIMGIISPYGILGGSVSYPLAWGWHARAGVGLAIPPYGIVNAEIGYRSHRISSDLLLEGVTLSVRAGLPF